MKITPNFTTDEFACRDQGKTPYPSKWVDDRLYPLCQALEKIRERVGRPLAVKSGYRTPEHNAKQDGAAKSSQHLKGLAADIRCVSKNGEKPISARELYRIVEEMIRKGEIPDGGLGSYAYHVHYDQGPAGRRWRQ